MRLVTWNCRMGLHQTKKWKALVGLQADVVVIPESPSPDHPRMMRHIATTRSHVRVSRPGDRKGLTVVSFGEYTLSPLPRVETEPPDAVAMEVHGPGTGFTLIAAWTYKPGYIERLHDALDNYEQLLAERDVVLAGDLNSNAIWDKKHKDKCHSRLVQRLEKYGLASAYHTTRAERHGAETEMTWVSNKNKAYHLDYVFIPRTWFPRLSACTIGTPDPWLGLSDHCPLTVEIAA